VEEQNPRDCPPIQVLDAVAKAEVAAVVGKSGYWAGIY
jgi:hypothetical protein